MARRLRPLTACEPLTAAQSEELVRTGGTIVPLRPLAVVARAERDAQNNEAAQHNPAVNFIDLRSKRIFELEVALAQLGKERDEMRARILDLERRLGYLRTAIMKVITTP